MNNVFVKEKADCLAGGELEAAKRYIVRTLSEITGLSLEGCGEAEDIHRTDIQTASTGSPYVLTWQGFVASSDYRDDGKLAYGAHLFPLIGGTRACLLRIAAEAHHYDHCFRYLRLEHDEGWIDCGWQIDEFNEFEDFYVSETTTNHRLHTDGRGRR